MHAGSAVQGVPIDEAGLIDLTTDDDAPALAPDQAMQQQEEGQDEIEEVDSDNEDEVVDLDVEDGGA